MNTHQTNLLETWFSGLNVGDLNVLLPLFAESSVIHNAANPPLVGADAARKLLEEFFRRTSARNFQLIDAGANEREIFATWEGTLTFPAGTAIAEVTIPKSMTVPLRGVDRFQLDASGRIEALDIVHETTSVVASARALVAREAAGGLRQLVENYFSAEERGDAEAVVALCAENVVIRNAAQPAVNGLEAARQFVTNFRDRTSLREFHVLGVAETADIAWAQWEGRITFRAGAVFGPVTAAREFTVKLPGVCRFKVNAKSAIVELDIFHETSTAVRMAMATLEAGKP